MNDASLDHFLGAKPDSRKRRAFSLGLLAVATVAAVALFIRFLVGIDVPYYTAPAELDDFTPVLTARGEVHGQNEITVNAGQDGVIATMPVPGGDAVNQGQPLALFDPATIAQGIRADRVSLALAQAALDRATIAKSETAARLARYENVWRRSNRRVPSVNEMEGARADARRATVDFDAARPLRNQARLQLAASQAKRRSAAVLAPTNGFVTARWVEPGQYVRVAQPLFTLATSSGGLKLVVPVGAAQAETLALQAKARVLIDGLPDRTRTATLVAIMPPASGSAQRQAVFTLDQPEQEVRPGMMGTIATELPKRRNVLLVPDAAFSFVPGGKSANFCRCIYVLTSQGTARRVAVAVGGSDGNRTEVLSSEIEPGTKIIIGWRGGTAARQ